MSTRDDIEQYLMQITGCSANEVRTRLRDSFAPAPDPSVPSRTSSEVVVSRPFEVKVQHLELQPIRTVSDTRASGAPNIPASALPLSEQMIVSRNGTLQYWNFAAEYDSDV